MSKPALIALTIASGLAITLQGQFMGVMDRVMGTRESVFVTYGSGGALALAILLAARGGNLRAWSQAPWYVFTAGLLGVMIVGAIGVTVSRLGSARAFTLIVASQFLLAALIDHFGWLAAERRPLDPTRLCGLAVLLTGVWMVVRE